MLPRRGLDEFVTGSAAPPASVKTKDATKKDEKGVDAAAAGRPWKAAELRRMYSPRTAHMAICLPAACLDRVVRTLHFRNIANPHAPEITSSFRDFNQLHELWWVLLKERNHLLTMRDWARAQRANIPNPQRIVKASARASAAA